MKEGNTNGTTTIISTIDTLCQGLLVISFFIYILTVLENTNEGMKSYGILIISSFLIYFTLAVYRLVYQFNLGIMSGINASVISVFILSLLIWTVTEGNVFGDGAFIVIILIFATPLVLIGALQEKFKDSPGWKKFVVGLFCSLPFSLLSVVVSLGIVIGFIDGNLDDL
tara:strand:- start:145 stop:651 length:507 start_codon:yes stop_codon:yes gene_type:complete